MTFFSKRFSKVYEIEDLRLIDEETIIMFFSRMRNGEIARLDGKPYKGVGNFVKVFKAFWHWHITLNRKLGETIEDITIDLDSRDEKPKWVYLTDEQIKKLASGFRTDYRALIMFLYDSGMRVTEAFNIRVRDFSDNFKEVMVRDEVSKTFGRKIKLMFCTELIKKYIEYQNFEEGDYIFPFQTTTANRYIQRTATKILGDKESPAGNKYSSLSMYDFRHCSCCYWMPRYKNESGIKYRFGWKKSDKIHYYSEFLGMRDTIVEDDILLPEDKIELERRLDETERKYQMVSEENSVMAEEMKIIRELVEKLGKKIK